MIITYVSNSCVVEIPWRSFIW